MAQVISTQESAALEDLTRKVAWGLFAVLTSIVFALAWERFEAWREGE